MSATAAPVIPVDDVLDIDGAAAFLKTGPKTIRRLVRLGSIPHRVINTRGSVRFSKAALAEWLRGGKQK